MKKLTLLFVGLMLSTNIYAGNKGESDQACFNRIINLLQLSSEFSNMLGLEEPSQNQDREVKCTSTSTKFGLLNPGRERGDRVYSGNTRADIVLVVRPLINGMPLGGTQINVQVEGMTGSVVGIKNSDFFEVSNLSYTKSYLRSK
ncbi:MAG: hypothetical protein HYW85_04035 [Deltaproteobacteria bacterium]|nr:hypothetical protein [Deltaproteobacteria bacterium]